MAGGWSKDGSVDDQIQDSINDEISRVQSRLPRGEGRAFCEKCGGPIPEARKKALPGVRLCIDCQEEAEAQDSRINLYNRKGSKDSQLR